MFRFIPINRSKVLLKGHFRFKLKFKNRILKTLWKMAKKVRIHFRVNCEFFPAQWFVIEFKYKLILHHYSVLSWTKKDDFHVIIQSMLYSRHLHYCVSVFGCIIVSSSSLKNKRRHRKMILKKTYTLNRINEISNIFLKTKRKNIEKCNIIISKINHVQY